MLQAVVSNNAADRLTAAGRFVDALGVGAEVVILAATREAADDFCRSLAARRGVDVRLLLPESTDHPYVDRASSAHFRKAFKSGVKIFRYQGAMLHAKTLVVDGDWASVGSANIDNLSSFINYELNLASSDKRFAEDLRNQFLGDLTGAKEVDSKTWKNRSIFLKALELLCSPFGRFF